MRAQLIESPDEHHWVLLEHRVTQLVVETRALRVQTWGLHASTDLRLGAPFTLQLGGGAPRALDPELTEGLAPTLALVRRALRSVTIARSGELTVELEGAVLAIRPSPRVPAWELIGGGSLEGMSYRCEPGGRAPWGD